MVGGMARRLRLAPGGVVYHVLNRAVGRGRIFEDEGDYAAFEKAVAEAHARTGTRLLAYCLMPNHWHLVLWPRRDGELSQHLRWLTVTHTQRWHARRRTAGTGPLYQGRFKSFPIQRDRHLLLACRYVERNALRANLVKRAQDWPWCSLARRLRPDWKAEAPWLLPQEDWPVEVPADWLQWVNGPVNLREGE